MSVGDLFAWTGPRFKHDEPSRVDDAILKDARASRDRRRWDREIDARDRRECRACNRKSDPDVVGLTMRGHRHHIVYASACGGDEPANRVTLCCKCHNDEHKERLRFTEDGTGYADLNANAGLEFWRKDDAGQWCLVRRELAPHMVEKD